MYVVLNWWPSSQWFCCGVEEWGGWHRLPLLQMDSSEIAPTCWTAQQARSSLLQRCIWNPFPNTQSCSQFACLKWSVSPSDAVSCPQGAQNRQKTVAVCPFYALNIKSWAQGTYTADTPNSCPLDVTVALGFGGSLWAACQRLAEGRHCSLLCTTVISPIKIPSVLRLFNRAAHRQLTHQWGCLLCWFPLQCGHSCTMAQQVLTPEPLIFFTFRYPELGICLSNLRLVFWISPLLKHGFSVKFFDLVVLLWERLGQSCVGLRYFSAVSVAVPWFFWMGQEKVVAGLINSEY